jgi:DNA-binding NarL/FixJ family response regulator
METPARKMNLFILSDNALVVCGLKHSLLEKFGDQIRIYNFYDRRSCLRRMNEDVQIVVLDHFISGRSANDTRLAIKSLNPGTEVIMHSSPQEVIDSILAFESRLSS